MSLLDELVKELHPFTRWRIRFSVRSMARIYKLRSLFRGAATPNESQSPATGT